MLYREIIAVYSQIHTKHINTLCGQNVELLNVVYITTTWINRVTRKWHLQFVIGMPLIIFSANDEPSLFPRPHPLCRCTYSTCTLTLFLLTPCDGGTVPHLQSRTIVRPCSMQPEHHSALSMQLQKAPSSQALPYWTAI